MGLLSEYTVEERDRFGNRLSFYLAAVGSAVGFGNVWRFPSLAYKYGGAAFLIPYGMALFLIGIPILFLEIGLGQFHQTGDVGVFGSFNTRLRGIGLCSIVAGYVLVTYYSMLIAWCMNAFVDTWSDSAPWLDESLDDGAANSYFFNRIVGMENLSGDHASTLIPANVGYSFLTWFIVFVSIGFGSKWTGRITYFTMGFPILLLFIFLFRGVSLTGASDGIDYYIGKKSDISALSEKPDVWTIAVTQIFFSLSVTFGTMTAYGSLVPRSEPAFLNSTVVAISNCSFSFIAGFAVFSSIGHLAHLTNVDVSEVTFTSFGLVFGTWPVVLGSLPGGIHWIRLLFLNLVLLGIDSAFSILEGVTTVMGDTTLLNGKPKWLITLIFSVVGFLCSLLYATDAGLFWLDAIDYYINFMLLLVGFLETFAVGFMYNLDKQNEEVGAVSSLLFMFGNLGGALVAGGLWFGLKKVWPGFVAYIIIYVVCTVLAIVSFRSKGVELGRGLYVLYFKNVFDLRDQLQPVIGWVPTAWSLLMRHFIPQVLLILFINGAAAKQFGEYGGYDSVYQVVGILCVAWIAFMFLLGVVAPDVYKCFALFENSGARAIEADEVEKDAGKDGEVEMELQEQAQEQTA
jgi:SNF family Na+-dependent transporter